MHAKSIKLNLMHGWMFATVPDGVLKKKDVLKVIWFHINIDNKLESQAFCCKQFQQSGE